MKDFITRTKETLVLEWNRDVLEEGSEWESRDDNADDDEGGQDKDDMT
jgi:hypothetical protein